MAMKTLEVTLGRLRLRTPLMTASGTSGSSHELQRLRHGRDVLEALGAFVTKGVTLEPKRGNPEIRVVETRGGLINSIGLQNSGAKAFLEKELPQLRRYERPIIVNISANTVEEFGRLTACLVEGDREGAIAGLEVNVSCPNIHEGGIAFGVDPRQVEKVVRAVKRHAGRRVTVITKLSPNVTDIIGPARGAIEGGTDALSMINTVRGMAINLATRRPFLGNVHGGLSGPAIKPIGVYMVYQCFGKIPECRKRQVPIVGIGGVSCWQDAAEYLLAGATAVGIGTAWFVNPDVFAETRRGLQSYLEKQGTTAMRLVGASHS
jgi:dihydroorotate dehydrogenase (NAD+) catalytic subunit